MGQPSLQTLVTELGKTYNFKLDQGNCRQLGACLTDAGCNFAVYAPDADDVYICLYDKHEQLLAQIALTQRTQSKWFGFIEHVNKELLYGIRINPKKNRQTHPDSSIEKLLIDPYAKSLNRALHWDQEKYANDSSQMVPKAHILAPSSNNLTPLLIKPEQRVIYETHVKGLTALHPKVPESIRGTYLGACHPALIAHLKSLGITSVQFLPLMSFMPEPFITQKGLTNYWGYNPINFFAAEPRYASQDAVSECKAMIQAYRDANIEVILDVVFNHTCESGYDGPVISFRGLCESHAYLIEQNDESEIPQYSNFSGCGNTLKVSDTFMCTLVIDALRYWVSEMGVSGFRFDLASVVGREVFEFTNKATFFKILNQDPILKHALLLAEPWDIGPGGYQLGHFPHSWLEVNDKFRDVVKAFWRGDKGLKGVFATRIMGSKDIFRKNIRPMFASVNNVTYHDGFTLHDCVSYEQKHNEANLEENRDGHGHNLTANYGIEGITNDEAILSIREQQKRNLFATLLLSQGTPHILGGDELSRTQLGNNNAYCQDNEINWYQWTLDDRQQAFLDYCTYVIKLRQQYPLLQQMNFADDKFDNKNNIIQANWYRRDGSHKSDIDWVNHEHHCFALHIVANPEHGQHKEQANQAEMPSQNQQWLFCINSLDKEREFNLPVLHTNDTDLAVWECVLDTSSSAVNNYRLQAIKSLFDMPARSMHIYKK